MERYVKHRPGAPAGFFGAEAAGLRWLDVPQGAPVVRVFAATADGIEIERLTAARPVRARAVAFGAALAVTHASGAAGFGVPPDGWDGPTFIGNQRLSTCREGWPAWGGFYAAERVLPYARLARDRGHLDPAGLAVVEAACDRVGAGALDDGAPPSRIHGDLWNGNVLWTESGARLIDPAAHGGHRETDLAMLDLFGCPFLDTVIGAYDERMPLAGGWRQRVPLHQLHPLAVHAASHGASYAAPLVDAARAVLAL